MSKTIKDMRYLRADDFYNETFEDNEREVNREELEDSLEREMNRIELYTNVFEPDDSIDSN